MTTIQGRMKKAKKKRLLISSRHETAKGKGSRKEYRFMSHDNIVLTSNILLQQIIQKKKIIKKGDPHAHLNIWFDI